MRRSPGWRANDAGQGAVEYVGALVVAAALVLALAAAAGGWVDDLDAAVDGTVCALSGTSCAPAPRAAAPAAPAEPAPSSVQGGGLTARPFSSTRGGDGGDGGEDDEGRGGGGGGSASGATTTVNGMPAGDQVVAGLGARKAELRALGMTSDEMAIAMLESDDLSTNYAYGDNKFGDATNYGMFKQNWGMIREANPDLAAMGQEAAGALLNADPAADLKALRTSQAHFGSRWVAGHRNGATGLANGATQDIRNYRDGVGWIAEQLDADPAAMEDDVRYWVSVPPI